MVNDKKLQIMEERNYKVFKANEIIQRAKYDLNIVELKGLAYIFSKIKREDTKLRKYTLYIKEYCQVCGIDYKNGGNYKYIKETLKGLRDKSFWITDEDGKDVLIGWIQSVRINKGSGKIEVELDKELHRYLIGLLDNYTQYALLSTIPMKSAYSFRMYEILKSYAFTKHHTFDLDELKEQIAAQRYVNFKDFRRKVLEVATKEINLYTDIEVQWQPIKKGKKVIMLDFDIKQRDSWGEYFAGENATKQIEGQLNLEEYYK